MVKRVFDLLVRGVMVAFWCFAFFYVWDKYSEPVTYHSYVALNSSIKRGSTIEMELRLTRHRYCATTRDRFIINYRTGEIVFRDRVEGAVSKNLGYQSGIRTFIKLPDDMKPGLYTIRSIVYSSCLWHDFNAVLPEDHIEVEPN